MVKTDQTEIRAVSERDQEVIKKFLSEAGTSLQTFRYFERRDFDVLKNHVVTAILFFNGEPVGYGHLDAEKDRVWLGVAIGEGHLGKGLGSKVVSFLLNRAKAEHIKIVSLSVDVTNLAAISLYKRLGFEVIRNLNENVYLMECKTDAQC